MNLDDTPQCDEAGPAPVNGKRAAVMLAIALPLAVVLTLWTRKTHGLANERALFWGVILPWSAAARIPGALLGEFLGGVSRLTVGWFSAVMAGTVVVLILNFLQDADPLLFVVQMRAGLLQTAVVFGMLAATISEGILSALEIAVAGTDRR